MEPTIIHPYLVICVEKGRPIYAEAYDSYYDAHARRDELAGLPNLDALVWSGVLDGVGQPFYSEYDES